MEKIQTAEELIEKTGSHEFWQNFHLVKEDLKESMIEFARLHVEQALKEAVKHLPYDDKMNQSLLDERAILNSYSLENIK
jgi:hypothetical protein